MTLGGPSRVPTSGAELGAGPQTWEEMGAMRPPLPRESQPKHKTSYFSPFSCPLSLCKKQSEIVLEGRKSQPASRESEARSKRASVLKARAPESQASKASVAHPRKASDQKSLEKSLESRSRVRKSPGRSGSILKRRLQTLEAARSRAGPKLEFKRSEESKGRPEKDVSAPQPETGAEFKKKPYPRQTKPVPQPKLIESLDLSLPKSKTLGSKDNEIPDLSTVVNQARLEEKLRLSLSAKSRLSLSAKSRLSLSAKSRLSLSARSHLGPWAKSWIESPKSSEDESGEDDSDGILSSKVAAVTATSKKCLGKGEYCVLCTGPKLPGKVKSSEHASPGQVQDRVPPVGIYMDTCWLPRSFRKEELMRSQFPRGFTSLASTPTSPVYNIQHFWDRHLSTLGRFTQSPKITLQNLPHTVAFLTSSKRLQQLLKAQEELEKKMQRELTTKAQVEQEMIKLNGELNRTRAQRKQLIEDHYHIQNEIKPFLSDNSMLMGYLPDPTKKTQVAPIKVWDQHTQQQDQIKLEQQQLISRYESNMLNLQEELLQQEVLQAQLKKKIQGLNARKIVQLTQEEQIKSLQMLEPLVQKEAEEQLRRAQGSLIAEWKALKHQLCDIQLLLEKSKTGKYNHILEQAADKSIVNFARHLQGESEHLHKEINQLIREAQEVEAQRIRLRRQKQQLQLEECCLESLKRGRKLKLTRANPYQKGQISPKTILAPLRSTKPRLNPS
uniref:Uncharacterized LOC103100089 n=1 Tax=Monodelphis domestica TaxID=13616 RepID=F7BI16_MONDO